MVFLSILLFEWDDVFKHVDGFDFHGSFILWLLDHTVIVLGIIGDFLLAVTWILIVGDGSLDLSVRMLDDSGGI